MRFLLIIFILACQAEKAEIPGYKRELLKLEQARVSDPKLFQIYLDSENEEKQLYALEVISKIQDTVYADILIHFAKHQNIKIRKIAIIALGQLFNPLVEEYLKDALFQKENKKFRSIVFKSLVKVASIKSLPSIQKYIINYSEHFTGYDITPLLRRDEKFNKLFFPIIKNWKQIPREAKNGYYFFFSRLKTELTKKKSEFFFEEFDKNFKDSTTIETSIAISDLMKTIEDLKFDHSSFLKKYFQMDLNWRILIRFLEILKKTKKSIQSEYLYDMLSLDSLHPYTRDYIIRHISEFKVNQPVYTYLILDNRPKNYIAIAYKYPEETIRYINNNFQARTISEQCDLVYALFNTNRNDALIEFSKFYSELDEAVKTTFIEKASKTTVFSDSFFIEVLEEADIARSDYIARYAVKHEKQSYVGTLIQVYKKLNETTDIETMLTIFNSVSKLSSKNEMKSFLESIREIINHTILVKKFNKICQNFSLEEIKNKENLSLLKFTWEEINKQRAKRLEIVLNMGRIYIDLFNKMAIQNITNIVSLSRKRFYNGLSFHRLVPNFVVQGGDPRGDGWGSSGKPVPCEYTNERFSYGTVGIATAGKDTGSSQFFLMQRYSPHLDGKYTVIGRIVKGFEILEKINFNEKIFSINVIN